MAELIIKQGDITLKKYSLHKATTTLGRSESCDIVLSDPSIRLQHAQILQKQNEYYIENLDPLSKTYINGKKIDDQLLNDHDIIAIAKHRIIFLKGKENSQQDQKKSNLFWRGKNMKKQKQKGVYYLVESKGKRQGQKHFLTNEYTSIGKGKSNDICIRDLFISRIHAHVEKKGDRYYLRDEGTWRGTQVNGENISEIPLMDGDIVSIGNTELEFRFDLEEHSHDLDKASLSNSFIDTASSEKEAPPQEPEEIQNGEVPLFAEEEELQFEEDIQEDELSALEPDDLTEEDYSDYPDFEANNKKEQNEPSTEESDDKKEDVLPEQQSASVQKEKTALTNREELAEKLDMQDPEIKKWYNGLQSKKPALRVYAAKQLKKLTGIDIDPSLFG